MLIFRLISLIKGYVVIKLETAGYEKTINLLRRKGIRIWDIEKYDKGIKFKITYDDYKKYSELMKKTNLNYVKQTGFALKLNKIIRRKGFIVGIFILVICLFVFTSLIWNIEIIGTDQLTSENILRVLKENEITMPSSASVLDEKNIETILYNNFSKFKFVEAYVEGSKLIIFIKEKLPEKLQISENIPTSIISSKNAIINKIIAKTGQPVVKEGDVVYEGQTLIMGIIKNKNSDDFMMVPSEGIVYGKTYYSYELKEDKIKNVVISTDKKKSVYYLQINDKKVKIIGDTKPFENYNYKENTFALPFISSLINIKLQKGTYYEENEKEIEIDKTTAKNSMKVKMYDDLLKKCSNDSRILQSDLNFTEDSNYYYLNAQLEVIEDIGEKVRIYPTEITDKTKTEENKED